VTERLFVYGTLMPGGPLWPALRPFVASWQPASAPGRLWDTGNGYPAARFGAVGGLVPGVLVTIDAGKGAEVVALLDDIEGEGVLYRRVDVPTSCGPAVGYEWLGSTEGLIALPGGWRALAADATEGTAMAAVPSSSLRCSD